MHKNSNTKDVYMYFTHAEDSSRWVPVQGFNDYKLSYVLSAALKLPTQPPLEGSLVEVFLGGKFQFTTVTRSYSFSFDVKGVASPIFLRTRFLSWRVPGDIVDVIDVPATLARDLRQRYAGLNER